MALTPRNRRVDQQGVRLFGVEQGLAVQLQGADLGVHITLDVVVVDAHLAGLLPLLRAGRARVTSQVSIAANSNAINWDDLGCERSYHFQRAYSQSKIALGLFGLELEPRSQARGWGITSNLSHPGVAPTGLLSARPELGRERGALAVRGARALSRRGILLGTVETALLPALMAATSPDARGGRFYGPSGLGHLSGAPAEQALYSRLRSEDEAARLWEVSEKLSRTPFPAAAGELVSKEDPKRY